MTKAQNEAGRSTSGGDEGIRAEKAALRDAAAERRKSARRTAGRDAPLRILHHIESAILDIGLVSPEAAVSAFWPIRNEIDTRPILRALHARGHVCCLPVTTGPGRPLLFRQWRPGDALEPRPFGLMEPAPGMPEVEPDLLLVPLLAFDRSGYRLGYGGGFYDRTLAALRARKTVIAAGIAFADQEVERVPRDDSDEPLDWIITEKGACRIAGMGDRDTA